MGCLHCTRRMSKRTRRVQRFSGGILSASAMSGVTRQALQDERVGAQRCWEADVVLDVESCGWVMDYLSGGWLGALQ